MYQLVYVITLLVALTIGGASGAPWLAGQVLAQTPIGSSGHGSATEASLPAKTLAQTSADIFQAQQADLIWVRKSEYTMHLIAAQQIIASYPIALGQKPLGPKISNGDGRTPEGLYFVDYRNEESDYFLSLHISYPNMQDLARAQYLQVDPGGDIVIHGEPNEPQKRALLSKAGNQKNWTDGCIAVNNAMMLDIWERVPEGTPVLIEP